MYNVNKKQNGKDKGKRGTQRTETGKKQQMKKCHKTATSNTVKKRNILWKRRKTILKSSNTESKINTEEEQGTRHGAEGARE